MPLDLSRITLTLSLTMKQKVQSLCGSILRCKKKPLTEQSWFWGNLERILLCPKTLFLQLQDFSKIENLVPSQFYLKILSCQV